jgi:hypothetical protein
MNARPSGHSPRCLTMGLPRRKHSVLRLRTGGMGVHVRCRSVVGLDQLRDLGVLIGRGEGQ